MWTMLRKYRRGLAEICVLFGVADSCDVDNQDGPQHVRSRETGTGLEHTIFGYSSAFIAFAQKKTRRVALKLLTHTSKNH